jgi:hypothetical protein
VTGGIDESAEASGGRSVRVELQVTQHEFALLIRWLLAHLPGLRWLAALMLMLLAAGATLIAIVSPWIGAVLVGLVGLQFALWGWLIATTPRRAWMKRGAEAGANQVLEFSDQGVHVQTVNTDSMAKWPFYPKTIEHRGLYLLGVASGRAYRIVPARAFASSSDEEEFRHLVEEHTAAKLIAPTQVTDPNDLR